jgi:hypothetical protein
MAGYDILAAIGVSLTTSSGSFATLAAIPTRLVAGEYFRRRSL